MIPRPVPPGFYMVHVKDTRPDIHSPLVCIMSPDHPNFWVPSGLLQPLPPSLTAEAQAVLDAAAKWRGDMPLSLMDQMPPYRVELVKAVDAYRASITPPDPLKELRKAWIEREPTDVNWYGRMSDAIAAVEAAQKAKP